MYFIKNKNYKEPTKQELLLAMESSNKLIKPYLKDKCPPMYQDITMEECVSSAKSTDQVVPFVGDKPKIEEKPKIKDKPKIQNKPKVENQPKVKEKSKLENKPKLEDQPKVEEKSKFEDKPKVEDKSKFEDKPKVKETSKLEDKPKVEEKSKFKEIRKVEEIPKVEEILKVEEKSKIEVTLVTKKTPVTDGKLDSLKNRTCEENRPVLMETPIYERYCLWITPIPASAYQKYFESIPKPMFLKKE